jgi:hypothetical protein
MPRVELDAEALAAVGHGRSLPANDVAGPEAALMAEGRLIAVAERVADRWQPRVVMEAA